MIIEDYKVGIYLRLSREDERLGESSSISNQRDLPEDLQFLSTAKSWNG